MPPASARGRRPVSTAVPAKIDTTFRTPVCRASLSSMFASRLLSLVVLALLPLAGAACTLPNSDRGGSGQVDLTIPQLENVTDPDYPGEGSRVVVSDVVVSAVDNFDEDGTGRIGNVWVQEPGGGAWSAVQLYNPVVIPSRARLTPGDIVEAIGTLDEFVLLNDDGTPMDQDGTQTELESASVQKIGETLAPGATTIPEIELTNLVHAEPWENVLVRLENVSVTGGYDRYDELTTEGGVTIAQDLYTIPDVAAGTTFRSLSGIVTYFFGFKLLPRGPEDVVVEP